MHLLNICIWTSALLVLAGAALYVQGRPSGFDQVQNILGDTDHHLDEEYYDDEEPTSTEVQCSNPPCSRNESFMWLKGHWTQCNAVCDGGQRHRPVICYESTFARHVSDLHCKTKKPRNRMECAMDPCPGEWRNGPWSACTASCGVGIQYRHVACHLRHHQQLVVKRDVRIANITLCNPATRPLKVRFCNITESNCPPRIPYPSDNRELSIMADLGVDPDAPAPTTTEQHERQQSRIRRSIPAWRRDRRASFEQPRFEGPVVDEVIHHSTAQRASWKMIEVKRCSRKCGTGNRTIQAYCADTAHGDKPFEEVKCAKKPRPPARIVPCNTDPCIVEYRWLEAEWKPCSERCGNGTRSRRQICVRVTLTGTGEVVNVTMKRGQNRSLCGGQRSKEITEECRLKDCVGWHQGPWSQCTSPCKLRPGIQNTTTRCLNLRTGLPATDCDIANRPDDVRQCFSNRSCSFGWVTQKTCSATCDGGVLVVTAVCRSLPRYGYVKLPDYICEHLRTKPISKREACNPEPCPTLDRIESWGACSRSCGLGVQEKTLCVGYHHPVTRQPLYEPNCTLLETRECNAVDCPHRVLWSAWSNCSKRCGQGVQHSTPSCQRMRSDGSVQQLHLSECSEALPRGINRKSQTCFGTQCNYRWNTGPWSDCSTTCAEGQQFSNVTCWAREKGLRYSREEATDEKNCLKVYKRKPHTVRQCNHDRPCPRWQASVDFEQCNASCGQEGRQKLVFYCMRGSNEVDIEDCNNVTKPRDRFRPCMNPCRQAPSFNDNGVTRVISVNLNEPVRITCHAEGYPPPEVEWSWVNPTKHQVFESLRMTDGLTILKRGQLLVINHMVEGLEGRFTCTAKNSYNQVAHSSGMLAINQAPTFLDDPAAAADGPVHSIIAQHRFTFPCEADGHPEPSIFFYKNNERISETDSELCNCHVKGHSLFFNNASAADAGEYRCQAVNTFGTARSNTLTLQVQELYVWTFGEPSECTVSCGAGVTVAEPICVVSGLNQPVRRTFCSAINRPEAKRAECQLADCPAVPQKPTCSNGACHGATGGRKRLRWSPWSECSVTCGEGRQTRFRFCTNRRVNGSIFEMEECYATLSPEDAANARAHKTMWRRCHVPCIGVWKAIHGPCSASCGPGMQSLSWRCMRYTKGHVWKTTQSEAKCERNTGPKPTQLNQACEGLSLDSPECAHSYWALESWQPCQNHYRHRSVFCFRSGEVVDDSKCTEKKPLTREKCGYWKIGDWSTCNHCFHYRNVTCHSVVTDGKSHPTLCSSTTPEPVRIERCEENCNSVLNTGTTKKPVPKRPRPPTRRPSNNGCRRTELFYCNTDPDVMSQRLCEKQHWQDVCPCRCRGGILH